jgi:hypothetical protein
MNANQQAPAFILGVVTITLGTAKLFRLSLLHNREAFKPTRLYTHVAEHGILILEKVEWGVCTEEQLICPLDLAEFGVSQQGVSLAMPRLNKGEAVIMAVHYTGKTPMGLNKGSEYNVPLVWAEPGATLLSSPNATLTYSTE